MDSFTEQTQALLSAYKFALLCEEDNCAELEKSIRDTFSAFAEVRIAEIQKFAAANRVLIEQIFELGKRGVGKDSGEFQQILEQVKKFNDSVLLNAVLSSHDRGISEYEPEVSWNDLLSTMMDNSFSASAQKTQNQQVQQEIDKLLDDIRCYRTWRSDAGKMRELKEACERIRELDPAQASTAEQLLETGKQIADFYNKAYQYGMSSNKAAFDDIRKKIRKTDATEKEISKFFIQFNKGKKKKKMFIQAAAAKNNAPAAEFKIPYFDQSTIHPFYVGNLPEKNHWRIFIDETGCIFDKSVFDQETSKKQKGKLAALFIPEDSELPALGKHHATEQPTEKNQKVLADLFNKGNNCGILGITLDGMAQLDVDYWHAGFERLFDISLRLLPKSEGDITLDFYIENRGAIEDLDKTSAMLRRTADAALLHFGKSFPEQADRITIRIYCIAKTQTEDSVFMSYNGYIDTVACAWNGGRKELYSMLKKAGVIHRCLLDGDLQEFPEIMDRLARKELLSISQWQTLLKSPDTAVIDSLVNTLLAQLGFILRQDVAAWEFYVDEVLKHLDSKAIQLRFLNQQINYLTANMPPESNLPPRLKIIWLTAKLAEENHQGHIARHLTEQLEKILPSMYLEDAPLCCWSILHQAVTQTNAFRFTEARKVVCDFCDALGLIPANLQYSELFSNSGKISPGFMPKIAITGTRYYGQLLSTLGQHEAFCGNYEQANEYFLCALQCFSLLSDGGAGDIGQTSSYQITNLMDWLENPIEMIQDIENHLGNKLIQAANYMAVRNDDADKYRHHIMLRYFQLIDKNHSAIQAYLQQKDKWQISYGHPWEMIEFYRALLVDDVNERNKLFESAVTIAEKGGPTLYIIAAAIYGSWYYYDKNIKERFEKMAQQAIKELPCLGADRIAAVQAQLSTPLPPIEFIKKILPFNFR